MAIQKPHAGGDLVSYVSHYLSLTPEMRRLFDSTQSLQDLTLSEMAMVLSAFYED
jgi:hypothetical protein